VVLASLLIHSFKFSFVSKLLSDRYRLVVACVGCCASSDVGVHVVAVGLVHSPLVLTLNSSITFGADFEVAWYQLVGVS
jgi:hypothetical protein